MNISEDRIYHLAHLITDKIWKDDIVDYEEDDKVVRAARNVLIEYFDRDEKIAELVRNKIRSLKNSVFEGSREWEVLYKKYYEEEIKKIL